MIFYIWLLDELIFGSGFLLLDICFFFLVTFSLRMGLLPLTVLKIVYSVMGTKFVGGTY